VGYIIYRSTKKREPAC